MAKAFSNPSTEAILRFDQTPFRCRCRTEGCSNAVTRCTVARQNITPWFWCEECNPYRWTTMTDKFQVIRTYDDAVRHVNEWFPGNTSVLKRFLDELAEAKGLPQSALWDR